MKAKKRLVLLLIAVLQSAVVFNATAQVTKISNGILVKAGDRQVGLMVTNSAAFCLSISDGKAPSTIKSVFIDEGNKSAPAYAVIANAPLYGIKTAYGKLLINTNTKAWSLYDAAGHELVKDGTYSTTDSSIQIDYAAKGLLYGSGNRSSKDEERISPAMVSPNVVIWPCCGA